ncbi:MAG: FKBP-type peptidyl-prolyl cis-trans isomerase [Planctomycetes bacterium]|nr:FKBP-type peptidyl-prolyl cis-trans isomerase [Planctomycetota bacterium]
MAKDDATNPTTVDPAAKIPKEDSAAKDAQAPKDSKAKAPDATQIDQWIKDLGAEEYATRTAAELRLREAGAAAFEVLKAAEKKSDDAEVQARLKILVKEIGAVVGLEKLLKQEGIVTLPSGLKYKVLKEGEGKPPGNADSVVVNYKGSLLDGTEFDSSYKRKEPATLPMADLVKGWTEGLQKMKPGGKALLIIPPELGYGDTGVPPAIPPKATLVFEVELLEVKPFSTARGTPGDDVP